MTTQAKYSYESLVATVLATNYIVFSVKACSNASIALSQLPDVTDYNTYEIVLGMDSNTKSSISRGKHGPVIASAATPNMLDCNSFKTFWVRWTNDKRIEVGKGIHAGSSRFLTTGIESSFTGVASVAFTSPDGVTSKWELTEIKGRERRNILDILYW